MLLKYCYKFSFIITILLLQACNDSSTGQQPDPLHGHFLDNAVVGAQFVTPSMSGTTGIGGLFSFLEGETVEFYVGDIFLGSALGQEFITPRDFTDQSLRKLDEIYLPDDHTTNVVRFLQTIDIDGSVKRNDSNGILASLYANDITISAATAEMAKGFSMNFQQTVGEFETDTQVENTVATLTAPLSPNGEPRSLVPTNQALAHYTRTLVNVYGQDINWTSYLNPIDKQNSTYLLEENINGSLQSREVQLSYFTSHYGDYPVWVRSWGDNWKTQGMDYILRDIEKGVFRIGGVYQNSQYIHPVPELMFYPKVINDHWIINPDYRLPSDALKIMKIVTNQFVSTKQQDYENALKVTMIDETNKLRETHWYVADVGLVKSVTEQDNVTSTISLISQQLLTQIPVTANNEKFLASREIFAHSETQKASIQENLDNALATLYLAMLLSGDRDTDKHRELFHATYAIYVTEYSVSLTKKIISLSKQYALEAVTIEDIYNDARLSWVVNILVAALFHGIENSVLIDKVLADTATIFQSSMNLLSSTSVLDVEITLKPITSSDLK